MFGPSIASSANVVDSKVCITIIWSESLSQNAKIMSEASSHFPKIHKNTVPHRNIHLNKSCRRDSVLKVHIILLDKFCTNMSKSKHLYRLYRIFKQENQANDKGKLSESPILQDHDTNLDH